MMTLSLLQASNNYNLKDTSTICVDSFNQATMKTGFNMKSPCASFRAYHSSTLYSPAHEENTLLVSISFSSACQIGLNEKATVGSAAQRRRRLP